MRPRRTEPPRRLCVGSSLDERGDRRIRVEIFERDRVQWICAADGRVYFGEVRGSQVPFGDRVKIVVSGLARPRWVKPVFVHVWRAGSKTHAEEARSD